MEDSGFYLALPSNASAHIYRNNQSSDYTTNFPKPIELSEAWEVGLSEITYPHSWYNIKDKNRDFYCKRISEPAKCIKLKKGFYRTVDKIVSELNELLTLNNMEILPIYNPIHKRVQISGDADGVSYQRVGDICVPLLRTVHIDGKDRDIVTVNATTVSDFKSFTEKAHHAII